MNAAAIVVCSFSFEVGKSRGTWRVGPLLLLLSVKCEVGCGEGLVEVRGRRCMQNTATERCKPTQVNERHRVRHGGKLRRHVCGCWLWRLSVLGFGEKRKVRQVCERVIRIDGEEAEHQARCFNHLLRCKPKPKLGVYHEGRPPRGVSPQ